MKTAGIAVAVDQAFKTVTMRRERIMSIAWTKCNSNFLLEFVADRELAERTDKNRCELCQKRRKLIFITQSFFVYRGFVPGGRHDVKKLY